MLTFNPNKRTEYIEIYKRFQNSFFVALKTRENAMLPKNAVFDGV
jgi:hypothetical protein